MPSDRFDYALWRLTIKDDPEPLEKELKRLEGTSIGKQIVQARDLLAEHADDNSK